MAIYSPYKDTFERCDGLHSMEIEGSEREMERRKRKKERKMRRENKTEIRQVESSGIGSDKTPRFSSTYASARGASFLLLNLLFGAFIAKKCRY